MSSVDDDYAEVVLSIVEQIPAGQVATYGDIAEIVGRGGPRQVGHVMAQFGGGVPWWRVVRANGRPARSLEERGLRLLKADKTPLKGDRVDLVQARFKIDEAVNLPIPLPDAP
ncbi:MAG TPA: MGMT family protein [Propionibacteriaceae bacterium]|nr:MGMT family protein [Propionibacteriaceae bacterium]